MFWIFVGFALLASAITVNKVLLTSLPAVFFVGIRMFFGGIILCSLYYKSSYRLNPRQLLNNWKILLAAAVCTTFLPSILKAYGLKYLVSSKAAFIGALDPFITALYSYLLWSERLSKKKILGIFLGFTGTIMLCVPQTTIEETFLNILIFSLPELAAFGAVAIGRYGWILSQIQLKQGNYSAPELNGIIMLISGVLALVAAVCMGQFDVEQIPLTWNFLSLMVYTIVMGNVVAYTMYAQFLKAYSANFVSLLGFSVPLFVSFYGWLFLSEQITLTLIAAAVIILTGVYLFYQDELASLKRKA